MIFVRHLIFYILYPYSSHGVPLAIDYDLLTIWQPLLSGDKGLRHLIRTLTDEQISTVTQSQLSYDMDTPEQLLHARQQVWLDNCFLE